MFSYGRRGRTTLAWLLGFAFTHSLALAQEAAPAEEEPVPEGDEVDAEAAAEETAPLAEEAPDASPVAPADGARELLGVSGGLTADEAARAAASYTKAADVAREDQAIADARINQTIYNYAPRLTLTASYTRQSRVDSDMGFGDGGLVGTSAPPGPITVPGDPLFAIDSSAFAFDSPPNLWYLNAGLIVPISDYLLNMSQALTGAKSAKKAAKLQEQAARVNAAANARLAYYDWVRARMRMVEAQKAIERSQAQLQTLKDLAAAGRAARADVLRQDAQLAQTELGFRQVSTQEAVAREQLNVLMSGGTGTPPKWEVGEDVIRERPGDDPPATELDRLQQEAVEKRLEIESLEETEYALKQQKYVENTQGLPRVEGFGNLTYANPNQRYFPLEQEWNGSWDVGVRMVWTINDLGSKSADSKVTRSEIAKVRAQKQQLRDGLRTEVLAAYRGLQEANLSKESAARGLASAQISHEDRVRLFKAGKGTSLDVLEAETALVKARIDWIDTHIAVRQARVRFDHALGRDVDEVVTSKSKGD